MNAKNKYRIVLLLTVLFAIIQVVYNYPLLPDKVAIHFGISGYANNYGTKLELVIFQLGLVIFMSVFFYFIGKILHKIPDAFINLPYKKYWLAAERKEKSLKIISNELLRIIIFTNLLLILMFHLIAKANINKTFKLGSFSWLFLIIYFAFVTIDVIKLYRFFSDTKGRK